MKRAKLSQRKAAPVLGIHFTHLNKILAGRSVGMVVAMKLEERAGIPVGAWGSTVVDTMEEAR